MRVSILLLSGEVIELDVKSTERVLDLQDRVDALCPSGRTKLTLAGQVLSPKSTLAELGLGTGTLITAIVVTAPEFVLTTSLDKTAKLWRIETGECLQTFAPYMRAQDEHLVSAAFSRNGILVLTLSESINRSSVMVNLWSMETEECIHTFGGREYWKNNNNRNYPQLAVLSADGASALVGYNGGTLKLWSVETGACTQTFAGHPHLSSAVFSPDGASILTSSTDHTAKIWSIMTGECTRTFAGHSWYVLSSVFSGDGTRVLTSTLGCTAKLWSIETGECTHTFAANDPDSPERECIISALCSGPEAGAVTFFKDSDMENIETGEHRERLDVPRTYPAKLWNIETGECVQTFAGLTASVGSAVCSGDGASVLTISGGPQDLQLKGKLHVPRAGVGDHNAKLWSIETGECIQTFAGHAWEVTTAIFSQPGVDIRLPVADTVPPHAESAVPGIDIVPPGVDMDLPSVQSVDKVPGIKKRCSGCCIA